MKKRHNIYLAPQVDRRLDEYSRHLGVSKSQLVNLALVHYFVQLNDVMTGMYVPLTVRPDIGAGLAAGASQLVRSRG